jgi:aerobic-type carbon monoxide dehydrogenase small subunit (CoxS/CutS family)
MERVTELTVNGERRTLEVEPERSLLEVLRDVLDLTGAKYGCGEGQCGACTVLVGDMAVRSCVARLAGAADKPVTTIEGLARDGRLHPLQEAFLEEGAFQCGYCTPGMVLAALALLRKNPDPSEDEVRRGLEGNICRCGTYPRIIAAVRRAARALRERGEEGGRR